MTMPLSHAFLLFTACAIRNGAKPLVGYQTADDMAKARREGRRFVMV